MIDLTVVILGIYNECRIYFNIHGGTGRLNFDSNLLAMNNSDALARVSFNARNHRCAKNTLPGSNFNPDPTRPRNLKKSQTSIQLFGYENGKISREAVISGQNNSGK